MIASGMMKWLTGPTVCVQNNTECSEKIIYVSTTHEKMQKRQNVIKYKQGNKINK